MRKQDIYDNIKKATTIQELLEAVVDGFNQSKNIDEKTKIDALEFFTLVLESKINKENEEVVAEIIIEVSNGLLTVDEAISKYDLKLKTK